MISSLAQRFVANQQRVREMSQRFTFINQAFDDAGVRYAVVKGVSLAPEFCPDLCLRYQGDFDYLIDQQSLAKAQQILLEAGYVAKPSPSSQEFIFVIPGAKPARSPGHYDARSPHAVELHLDIWDSDYDGIAMTPGFFSVERSRVQAWNGMAFPALSDEDAFLLQILHACHHLFGQWIRMSCLLEIGYFLNRRAGDMAWWTRVEERVGDNSLLREFVVVVTELANKLFAAPLPPVICEWSSRIRPAPRVWIDHYSRQWALGEFPAYRFELLPKSKFVLFLRQQYKKNAPVAQSPKKGRAPGSSLLARMAADIRRNPFLLLNAGLVETPVTGPTPSLSYSRWSPIPVRDPALATAESGEHSVAVSQCQLTERRAIQNRNCQ